MKQTQANLFQWLCRRSLFPVVPHDEKCIGTAYCDYEQKVIGIPLKDSKRRLALLAHETMHARLYFKSTRSQNADAYYHELRAIMYELHFLCKHKQRAALQTDMQHLLDGMAKYDSRQDVFQAHCDVIFLLVQSRLWRRCLQMIAA